MKDNRAWPPSSRLVVSDDVADDEDKLYFLVNTDSANEFHFLAVCINRIQNVRKIIKLCSRPVSQYLRKYLNSKAVSMDIGRQYKRRNTKNKGY